MYMSGAEITLANNWRQKVDYMKYYIISMIKSDITFIIIVVAVSEINIYT